MGDLSDLSLVVPERVTSFDKRIGGPAARWGSVTSQLVSMTASQAVFLPIFLPWKYQIRRFFWCNGASNAGNVDVGIYSVGGARLASVGGVAVSATQAIQFATLGTPLLLTPGRYFLAYVQTAANYAAGGNSTPAASFARLTGFFTQASAYPLPSAATFAAYAGSSLPIFGFTRSASGV